MLDPTEQHKNGFRAAADRYADRHAAPCAERAPLAPPAPELRDAPGDAPLSLARLYERLDARVGGHAPDDGADLESAIVARLAANRRHAEHAGWTAVAIERDAESGRIRLVGTAPSAGARTIVPDWTPSVAADALARDAHDGRVRPHEP